MSLIKQAFSKLKKVLATSLVALFAVQLLLPLSSAEASGTPRFNFMENDSKTLCGVNRSESQNDWQGSISGEAGDEFRGLVYVHNGVLPSVAKNTKVKVTVPDHTTNKQATITAQISADNAQTVTDTMVVTLDKDADIEIIPNIVNWYPNVNGSATTKRSLPGGQNGDNLYSGGIYIGDETNFTVNDQFTKDHYPEAVVNSNGKDVHGCWNYVSYISFGFKTKSEEKVDLTIDKTVRNVTNGESNFVDANYAKKNETLEYKVVFKNTGNATIDRVVLTDSIPQNTSYINGSTKISLNGGDFQKGSDKITTDGLAFADLCPGEYVTVMFRVKIADCVEKGEVLTNQACVWFDKCDVCDIAKTTIVTSPTPPGPGPKLPVSGAATYLVSALIVAALGYGFYFMKRRRIVKSKENMIATELLSQ